MHDDSDCERSQPLEGLIRGSEKLLHLFGRWPSFHDAEVFELHFERGEVNEKSNTFDLPVLAAKIMVFDAPVATGAGMEAATLIAMRFADFEGFRMSGFNYQNAIYGLDIERRHDRNQRCFLVRFRGAFGMNCKFGCAEIEVLNAVPWNRAQRPSVWLTKEQMALL